ncbi:carboxymuconolactone decarboxylase family protein [Piscinibacter defluvii]|uniref:carboxymuconolactone decarboxylase family protein n=1 Tax=Piscinibacter defluvii TaxID=1796922 RepID=UPI000FDDC866|nr:carboxymuconolactone decarboxylase family protein [Piscinibacter defluvii]
MSSTTASERMTRRAFVAAASAVAATVSKPALSATPQEPATMPPPRALSARQQAIAPITAAAAVGDMPRLGAALAQGLDAGLTISDTKEILVQLYAYAGFPRSLNALGELMKVLEARRQRGVQDAPGREPVTPIPTGKALLALGTANQTQLIGAPVRGPLFEFAPAIDEYLKTHLVGDIFARDNLDWQSRELATVGMLAAMPGVESQMQSHIRVSLNVGLSPEQLREVAQVLARGGQPDAARRVHEALDRVLADAAER